MDQQQRGRRNLLQNLFITLLSLTAVMLFAQTQLYSLDLTGGYRNTLAGGESSSAPASAAGLTAPVRVAVTGAFGRYGSLRGPSGPPSGRGLGFCQGVRSLWEGGDFAGAGGPISLL